MGGEQDAGKTPQTPEQATAAAEAEYDKTWDEAGKAEGEGTPDAEPGDGTTVPPPDKETPTGDEPAPTDDASRTGEPDDTADLRKRMAETETLFKKVRDENAELRRQAEAARRGEGDPDALEKAKGAAKAAQDRFDELKKGLLEDYPELEGFMDETAKVLRELRGEVTELRKGKEKDAQAEARKEALDTFNSKVKPSILKEHADFDAVMADDAYWKWAEEQRPALRFAALDSPDPEDIIGAIHEYKKYKATPEAQALREKDQKTKNERLRNAQSFRPGAPGLVPKGSAKKDDYEGGWEEAGRELEREGVRVR